MYFSQRKIALLRLIYAAMGRLPIIEKITGAGILSDAINMNASTETKIRSLAPLNINSEVHQTQSSYIPRRILYIIR